MSDEPTQSVESTPTRTPRRARVSFDMEKLKQIEEDKKNSPYGTMQIDDPPTPFISSRGGFSPLRISSPLMSPQTPEQVAEFKRRRTLNEDEYHTVQVFREEKRQQLRYVKQMIHLGDKGWKDERLKAIGKMVSVTPQKPLQQNHIHTADNTFQPPTPIFDSRKMFLPPGATSTPQSPHTIIRVKPAMSASHVAPVSLATSTTLDDDGDDFDASPDRPLFTNDPSSPPDVPPTQTAAHSEHTDAPIDTSSSSSSSSSSAAATHSNPSSSLASPMGPSRTLSTSASSSPIAPDAVVPLEVPGALSDDLDWAELERLRAEREHNRQRSLVADKLAHTFAASTGNTQQSSASCALFAAEGAAAAHGSSTHAANGAEQIEGNVDNDNDEEEEGRENRKATGEKDEREVLHQPTLDEADLFFRSAPPRMRTMEDDALLFSVTAPRRIRAVAGAASTGTGLGTSVLQTPLPSSKAAHAAPETPDGNHAGDGIVSTPKAEGRQTAAGELTPITEQRTPVGMWGSTGNGCEEEEEEGEEDSQGGLTPHAALYIRTPLPPASGKTPNLHGSSSSAASAAAALSSSTASVSRFRHPVASLSHSPMVTRKNCTVRLTNMADPATLTAAERDALTANVYDECSRHGVIKKVLLVVEPVDDATSDTPEQGSSSTTEEPQEQVNVYVEFVTETAALLVAELMDGRLYEGRHIKSTLCAPGLHVSNL